MDIILDTNKLRSGVSYKVVQVTIDGSPLLCFVEHMRKTYHFMILQKILDSRNIPYNEIKVQYYTIPDPRGDRYCVNGMGGATILPHEQSVIFFGDSMDYGLGISREHLENLTEKNPDFRWEFLQEPVNRF